MRVFSLEKDFTQCELCKENNFIIICYNFNFKISYAKIWLFTSTFQKFLLRFGVHCGINYTFQVHSKWRIIKKSSTIKLSLALKSSKVTYTLLSSLRIAFRCNLGILMLSETIYYTNNSCMHFSVRVSSDHH